MEGEILAFVVIHFAIYWFGLYWIFGHLIVLPLMKRKRCDNPWFLRQAQDNFTKKYPITQCLDFKDFLIVAYEENFFLCCLIMAAIITSIIHHFSFHIIPVWAFLPISAFCCLFPALIFSNATKGAHAKIIYDAQKALKNQNKK